MSKIPLIIDCDPGVDDAIALFLADTLDQLDILAVSAVAGNVGLNHTYPNALKLCHLISLDVPVGKGAAQPLVKPARQATVHGLDGLGGFADSLTLPETATQPHTKPMDAVGMMYNLLLKAPHKVSLLAIGPLTNIAMLLEEHPNIWSKIDRIAIMGGGIDGGNVTPYSEFNFYVDPEAAAIVLNSGLPITLVDLNLTHQALLPEGFLEKMRALQNPVADFAVDIIEAYVQYDAYLHDVLALYTLTHPDLFEYQDVSITVVLENGERQGMSVLDAQLQKSRTIQLATSFQRDAIFQAILEGFSTYSDNKD